MTDRRLLLVHAHPDDESINNGATMARYVDEGVGVTLVTCTAGEMGEVLVPELAYLAHEKAGGLGVHRRGELAEAMKVLGVTDHSIFHSIYFFDPNGHRVELACPDPDEDAMLIKLDAVKWDMLEEWSITKKAPKHADWMHKKNK